jgi:hypothetical protein
MGFVMMFLKISNKMTIKLLTIISIMFLLFNKSYAGFFSSTLSKEEMKNLFVCEKTKTGVAKYSSSILKVTKILRSSGMKTIVSKSGSDLTIEMGQSDKITIELEKIDSGNLKKKNITCYQTEKINVKEEEFSRKDETLHTNAISEFFGYLLPTEKDIQLAKEKRAKVNAMNAFTQQEKATRQKALKDEKIRIKKEKLQAKRLANIKRRDKLKKLRNKYLSMLDKFEKESKILTLNPEKDLILTDKVIDNLVKLLNTLKAEININIKWRSYFSCRGIKDLYATKMDAGVEGFYSLYDAKSRISCQDSFTREFKDKFTKMRRYIRTSYDIEKLIK